MTYDENSVSDLHKDAFGFRPSQNWWADWQSMNPVAKQAEWDYLITRMNEREDARNEDERASVIVFEHRVTNTINLGAKSREEALRWIMQSSEADGDWEYFCYLNGLPYQYFQAA